MPWLLDNAHERLCFVRFEDEMPATRTPLGDFFCFGKSGYEKTYFVTDAGGAVCQYECGCAAAPRLVFVNSTLAHFVRSYSRYMAGMFMHKAHRGEAAFSMAQMAGEIAAFSQGLDAPAMADGAHYWPQHLHELEDGFAHLLCPPAAQRGGPHHWHASAP